MKVSLIVMVAAMVLAVTDAQFRLSNLFNGFRPLFGRPRARPRPRPRPQTIFISAGQFSPQSEQNNFIPQSAPPTSFLPVGQEVFQSRPAPRPLSRPPAPRPTQQPPPPPPPPSQSQGFIQRPQSPLRPFGNVGGEFGAPKPESLLSTSTPFRPSLPPVQTFGEDNRAEDQPSQNSPRRPGQSVVFSNEPSSTIFRVTNQNQNNIEESFPNPIPPQNNNNIIGMLPPPPPSFTTTTTTTTGTVIASRPPPIFSVTSPPSPLTTNTQLSTVSAANTPKPDDISATGPETNSIDTLVLNPIPLVNAGVLPLAGEISNEAQFFPPFNQISVSSFNNEREQRELFPPFTSDDRPNNELFPPFNNNES